MAQLENKAFPSPAPGSGRARYSRAWANMQFAQDPQHGVLPEPDPEHRKKGAGDPNPAWNAPVYQDSGQIGTDVLPGGVNHEGHDVPPTVPLIDRTPTTHVDGGEFSAFNTQYELQEAHNKDRGAALKERYQANAYEFFNERYYDAWLDGSPAPAITEGVKAAYVRGINSAEVNNGPSGRTRAWSGRWRAGRYQYHNVNRNFSPPRRQHDYRFVQPNVVTHIGDAPPPDKPDTYSSPFSSLQRFIKDIKTKPMARRVPPPFDEDLIYDGSADVPQAPVGYDGFGGF